MPVRVRASMSLIESGRAYGTPPHRTTNGERYTSTGGQPPCASWQSTRQGTRDNFEPPCAPLGAGLRKPNPALPFSGALSAWGASADPEWLPKTPKTHRSGASRTPPGQNQKLSCLWCLCSRFRAGGPSNLNMGQRGFSLLVPSSCFSLGAEPDQGCWRGGGEEGRRRRRMEERAAQAWIQPALSLDGGEMVSRRSQRFGGQVLGNVQAPSRPSARPDGHLLADAVPVLALGGRIAVVEPIGDGLAISCDQVGDADARHDLCALSESESELS
ncbi:uncharacterized protein Triagg1_1778 [Trichoderma aggressivum f. europaeum]|uniref:Uncharacterized protein n=1 Tax=Trichoderma aggressivum f. europaeum TaxID=173218 RepID=A0AAE1M2P2_9HYPO|nr:hypothetical protein Triagg1_1778 [Trichoderma aggressivum f. europaeum]